MKIVCLLHLTLETNMLFLLWKTDQNKVLQYIQMLLCLFFSLSEEPRTNSISEVELSFSQCDSRPWNR